MKFRRQNSLRAWNMGPAICLVGLILGFCIDAPALILAAGLLFLFTSSLAVEWLVIPKEKSIIKRVTVGFLLPIFERKYEINGGHRLNLKITPRGTKTQDGDFISDYAELELNAGDQTLCLSEGSDIDAIIAIAHSVSEALSIPIRKNEEGADKPD